MRSRLGLRFELVDEGCGDDNFLQTDFTGWFPQDLSDLFRCEESKGKKSVNTVPD